MGIEGIENSLYTLLFTDDEVEIPAMKKKYKINISNIGVILETYLINKHA